MKATVADIVSMMESIAPTGLAEDWDNVGLQVGEMNWPVKKIWTALEPTPDVVTAACEKKVDLLITHHPLIFSPLKTIQFDTPLGRIIHLSGTHKIAIYSAHTNLDNARNGLNDILAKKVGLKNIRVLKQSHPEKLEIENQCGTGRIGDLAEETDLASFAKHLQETFQHPFIKIAGDPDLPINTVAVCSGSGSSLLDAFISSGAQVYVSGDLRYHDARTVEQAGLALIDIGHFASEIIIADTLEKRIQKILDTNHMDVRVEACEIETDPYWSIRDG